MSKLYSIKNLYNVNVIKMGGWPGCEALSNLGGFANQRFATPRLHPNKNVVNLKKNIWK